MVSKLDPQTRNEIVKFLKECCPNFVRNKALENQKRIFSNVLLSKLRKEIKFSRQSKVPGKNCRRKEVLGGKEKKKLKKLIVIENFQPQRTLENKLQVLQ